MMQTATMIAMVTAVSFPDYRCAPHGVPGAPDAENRAESRAREPTTSSPPTSGSSAAPGLPLFVEGFSASTDVFNRAAPLLGLVFFGELLGAGQLDWTWWQNLLAVAGGARDRCSPAIAAINSPRAGRRARSRDRLGQDRARRRSCSCRRCCR